MIANMCIREVLNIPGGNGAGAPPLHGPKALTEQAAGALGMGMQFANAFVTIFKFLAYLMPLFGGWWADSKIGRYPAIMVGVLICGLAHIVQIVGAIPSVLQKGQGVAPFLLSLFLLAIGAGGLNTVQTTRSIAKPFDRYLQTEYSSNCS
jgi:hypothetical protein